MSAIADEIRAAVADAVAPLREEVRELREQLAGRGKPDPDGKISPAEAAAEYARPEADPEKDPGRSLRCWRAKIDRAITDRRLQNHATPVEGRARQTRLVRRGDLHALWGAPRK